MSTTSAEEIKALSTAHFVEWLKRYAESLRWGDPPTNGNDIGFLEVARRLSELERENAALREALKPWAKAAAVLDMPGAVENTGDGQPFEDGEILWGGETGDLTVADFRRARAVYEKTLAALDEKK